MARYAKQKTPQAVRNPFEPMLKTVEQMAVVSGIGENRLRQLMDNGELEFIQNGNRRLISEQAIWDYQRHPCGVGTFPSGNGRRIERGGRCPLRKFCRGRCVRPQRHDHPQ